MANLVLLIPTYSLLHIYSSHITQLCFLSSQFSFLISHIIIIFHLSSLQSAAFEQPKNTPSGAGSSSVGLRIQSINGLQTTTAIQAVLEDIRCWKMSLKPNVYSLKIQPLKSYPSHPIIWKCHILIYRCIYGILCTWVRQLFGDNIITAHQNIIFFL